MMGDAGIILHWSGVLTPANSELTEEEITSRYGGLIKTAISAFREDPSYIVEMAETCAKIKARRNGRSA